MNIPFLKAKKDTIQFSRQFYDTYIFGQEAQSLVSTYAEVVYRSLCAADPTFSRVQLTKLKEELLSLQLEMIGTSWTHKSKEIAAIANSEFTKRFLEERDRADLWEIMGQYNQRVAQSATYGSNSSSAIGRGHIAFMNTMRAELFDSWFAKGYDGEAVARVVNRIGSEPYWKKGITPTLLGIRTMLRLDFEGNDVIQ